MSGGTQLGLSVPKYDKQQHAEAVAHLAAKEAELAEVADKIHDNNETDAWDEAKMMKHTVLATNHAVLTDQVKLLREKVRDYDIVGASKAKQRGEPSALDRFLRSGLQGITAEEKSEFSVDETSDNFSLLQMPGMEAIKIDMPSITGVTRSDDSSAQELVPETVVPNVVEDLAFGGEGVMNMTWRFTTSTGNEYRIPQFNEANEMGTILAAQNTAIADNDLADFGITTFNARTATSGMIPITREALQDSIVDLSAFAERRGGRRIVRRWEKEYTEEGDGTGTRALSVQNGALNTQMNATADTLDWEDLVDLIHSIDRAYRTGGEPGDYGATARAGTVGFVLPDSAERLMMKMKDGDDRPVWMPGISAGMGETYPNRIFGYPYSVSMNGVWEDLSATSAGGADILAFGNWGYFGRRTVTGIEVFRFMDSATMTNNLIKILMLARSDFRPVGALSNDRTQAVSILTNRT